MNDKINAIFAKLDAEKDLIVKICVESNNSGEIKEKLLNISNSISDEDAETLSDFFSSVVSLSDEDLASVAGGVSYLG